MKDLIIIGAGGVGRETALIVEEINEVSDEWNLLGFIDENASLHHKMINDYPVLGNLEFLKEYEREVFVVCAISNYEVKRKKVALLTQNKNIKFATLIHPSVKLNRFIQIGEGCIIYPDVLMTTNIEIGNHVIISSKTGIGHDSIMEDYCSLLWGVNISGNVRVGEGVLLGSGAIVIQNIEIGKDVTIGAGAVVTRSINEYGIFVGIPARRVRG